MLLCLHASFDAVVGGELCGAAQRGGRDVDGGDVPAVRGQPQRVAALAASQVQGAPWRQVCGGLGEQRIGRVLPGAVLAAVEVLPEPGSVADGVDLACEFVHGGMSPSSDLGMREGQWTEGAAVAVPAAPLGDFTRVMRATSAAAKRTPATMNTMR